MIRVISPTLQVCRLLGVDPRLDRGCQAGMIRERGVRGDELLGISARLLDQVLVVQDVQELQLGAPAGLGRTQDVALPPLRHVQPSQLESIRRGCDGAQSLQRRLGVRAGHQQSEPGQPTAPDPTPQLVQL
jgi:hypothetical protein